MANSNQQSSMKIYLRLLKYVLPYWGAFAVSIVGFVLFASSQPMLADMLKHFLDALQKPDDTKFLGFSLVFGVPLLVVLIAVYQASARSLATTTWPRSHAVWFMTCAARCSITC